MKLAPAIEEFIQYKQALGNSFTSPARILRSFLTKTGNLEFEALTAQHADSFLPVKNGTVTNGWFYKFWALRSFFQFATSRGYIQHRILPASIPDRPPKFIPYIYSHYCPVKCRTESIGCRDRVSHCGSRMREVPVKWAFSQKE